MADETSMLFWLATACRSARELAGRIQSQVAASAVVDQSTINRFENHVSWPKDTDRLVKAYADDLDVEPIQLWLEAMRLWERRRAGESLTDLGVRAESRSPRVRTKRGPSRSGRAPRRSE